jgi:hypothetical protein
MLYGSELVAGLLLPESVLSSLWFSVLAAFVAINTVMYVSLAVGKILPKIHPRDWLPRTYERAQTRSIYPDLQETARPPQRPVAPWQARRTHDGTQAGSTASE